MTQVRRRVLPREERLRDVVREAARLFHDQGYERTTVDELADAMGISVGGLYRYVSTKSDALVMVCDDIYRGLPEDLQAVSAAHADPLDAVSSVVHRYLESCITHRALILLMYREFRHLPPDAQSRSKDKENAIADVLAAVLRRAQRAQRIRAGNVRLLAADILLLGHLPALKGWQLKTSGPPLSALADRHTALIVDALRRD